MVNFPNLRFDLSGISYFGITRFGALGAPSCNTTSYKNDRIRKFTDRI